MSLAKITIFGLYNFDNHLFDFLKLPEKLDKETLINNILLNCGEFEPLYADYDFLRFAIGTFSTKWQKTFERWLQIQEIEFNPIHNYDRYEEWTDNHASTQKGNSKTEQTNKNTGTIENEKTVSAYDSSTYQPQEKNTQKNDLTEKLNNGNEFNNKEDIDIKHSGHLYGNIGVTKSTEMALEYVDFAKWNIYDAITELFKVELTLPIY